MGAARSARRRVADPKLEMKESTFVDDLPVDDAIIALEETEHGWRGLTAKGEILDVRSRNGHKAAIPDGDLLQVRGDKPVSRRPIVQLDKLDHAVFVATAARTLAQNANCSDLSIGEYIAHFERALAFGRENRNTEALLAIDTAITLAPTLFAYFNRAMILLALGRWREGFEEYRQCEQHAPFMRAPVTDALAAGLKVWNGEEIAGKRLLLLHAHGHGDSLMVLRYVPLLQAVGAEVALMVPEELRTIAAQFAPVDVLQDADFVCPLLHVLGMLAVTPEHVNGQPYVHVDTAAVDRVREQLGPGRHVGIAWSASIQRPGDYPRAVPLDRLVGALGGDDANLHFHSVQKQDGLEALAHGVQIHPLETFADCAALMLAMDRIVSVDTAALHLAGAIGHPRVDGLLSHWASWRWLAPWYDNVRLRRQTIADDWDSALAQLE
jgi:hypothetical protein